MSEINFCQNEFIHQVNAYYQADAHSKKLRSSGLFGDIDTQPELFQFRGLLENVLVNELPGLRGMINDAKRNGKQEEIEKEIIKANLTENYGVSKWFFEHIENSITKYSQKPNGDMTSYRVSFHLGTSYIYNFVGGTIKSLGNYVTVSLKELTDSIINSILNENYWEGEILCQQIDCIRELRREYYFSDEWIREYAYRMFVKDKRAS